MSRRARGLIKTLVMSNRSPGLNSGCYQETALVTQVLGGIALKFAFIYRYNSEPEEEKEKVDTELSATLVYSFN